MGLRDQNNGKKTGINGSRIYHVTTLPSHGRRKSHWFCQNTVKHDIKRPWTLSPGVAWQRERGQNFRERLSEEMRTRQPWKVIWDMIKRLKLSNLLLLLSFSTRKHMSVASRFLWRTVPSKPPTIPFGIVACTFPDNLSRFTTCTDEPPITP